MHPIRLSVEAIFVGLGTLILFFIIHFVAIRLIRDEAKTHLYLAIQLFITGSLFHVIFELVGLNAWYCKNRED